MILDNFGEILVLSLGTSRFAQITRLEKGYEKSCAYVLLLTGNQGMTAVCHYSFDSDREREDWEELID